MEALTKAVSSSCTVAFLQGNVAAPSSARASLKVNGAAARSLVLKKSDFAFNAVAFKAGASRSRVVCMAKESPAAGYAAALLEVAKSNNVLDSIHKDVEVLLSLSNNAEVAKFLNNPTIADDQKKAVVKSIAAENKFSEYSVNFLNLLIDRRRISLIKDIAANFEDLYCQVSDTQVAIVSSAVKLENSQQALIAKKLQSLTGARNIKLKNVVDSSLIAGFVVKYGKDGSCFIDMSVKGQLDRLAAQFENAEKAIPSAS
eukprot:TRINITY_DN218_c0_g1_i3.p1 TRINITY_DN218_c0_g1~~TRINITY_DN218_c0_g1_i3.p1  ORF type:complete len:281 (+),score=83.70 TRINITY_DN218_c0_g1_i3:71-844(+)